MRASRQKGQIGSAIPALVARLGRRHWRSQTDSTHEHGYMLLDLVLTLTIVLLLSAMIWPMLGRGTGNVHQAAIALDIASLLRADRDAASERGTATGTLFDLQRRMATGASGRQIEVPQDIAISVTTGSPCMVGPQRFVIAFAPDGTSCGGMVRLSRRAQTYTIRINWRSGLIDVAHAQMP